MRLDHVSYVTSHDQIADTVQRLGSRLGTTFVDGGIHPRFGTRNFTAPLLDGKYIEVVCPLEHPATEQSPWGRAVLKKAQSGGGWLTWVISTEDIAPIEEKFGRSAVEGHRTRPDGIDLKWKQIGVKEIGESGELPFFIQWLTNDHPSNDGLPRASIEEIVILDNAKLSDSWFQDEIKNALGTIKIVFESNNIDQNNKGIESILFSISGDEVIID